MVKLPLRFTTHQAMMMNGEAGDQLRPILTSELDGDE